MKNRWVFLGFLLIAGYFLWTEHRAHVVQYLPILLLLACPLLHMFHGHGGHSGHGSDEQAGGSADEQKAKRTSGSPPGGKDSSTGQHHHR